MHILWYGTGDNSLLLSAAGRTGRKKQHRSREEALVSGGRAAGGDAGRGSGIQRSGMPGAPFLLQEKRLEGAGSFRGDGGSAAYRRRDAGHICPSGYSAAFGTGKPGKVAATQQHGEDDGKTPAGAAGAKSACPDRHGDGAAGTAP